MSLWLGIDGGGSNLRLVLADDSLNIIAQSEIAQSANPNIIGWDTSQSLIQTNIKALIEGHQVYGAGIGISGASAEHAESWLRETVSGVLPNIHLAPASDIEIALVGAHGQRYGILLLAGTGSVAYAINRAGDALQLGGWGYLLGDEGSGYWLGMGALKTFTLAHDGRLEKPSTLTERVRAELGLKNGRAIVEWLYRRQPVPVAEVARLARLVLEEADDWQAQILISEAADSLISLVYTAFERLKMYDAPIAFAGGLLSEANPLSLAVMHGLNLNEFPATRYSPVLGAALLAKLTYPKD
jgi:N-acetylglucosamine kinase-like BadF-type ATPase